MLRIPKRGDFVVITSPNVYGSGDELFALGTVCRVEYIYYTADVGLAFELRQELPPFRTTTITPYGLIDGCYPFAVTQVIENN